MDQVELLEGLPMGASTSDRLVAMGDRTPCADVEKVSAKTCSVDKVEAQLENLAGQAIGGETWLVDFPLTLNS